MKRKISISLGIRRIPLWADRSTTFILNEKTKKKHFSFLRWFSLRTQDPTAHYESDGTEWEIIQR